MRPILLFLSGFIFACAGSLDDPDRFRILDDITCPEGYDVFAEIIAPSCLSDGSCSTSQPTCAGSGCHAGTDAFSMDSEEAIRAHIGVESNCLGLLLIDESNVNNSYIFDKLDNQPSCGAAMPLGKNLLTDEQKVCFRDWLTNLVATN